MLAGPAGLLHPPQPLHIGGLQRKGEEVQIFRHSPGVRGLGQRHHPQLQGKAQADPGRGNPILLPQLRQQRMTGQPHPPQGAPGLDENPLPAAEVHRLRLEIPRMKLDLVDGRGHVGRHKKALQVVGQEVADPDGLHHPLVSHLLHGPPGLPVQPLPVRVVGGPLGPVDQQHVHIVDPQPPEALLRRRPGPVVAQLRFPDLGGHLPRLPGIPPQGPAYRLLVAVEGGGVEIPVSRGVGGSHRLLPSGLVGAVAHRRQRRAVPEDHLLFVPHGSLPFSSQISRGFSRKYNVTVVPRSTALSRDSSAPWLMAPCLTMDSPRPVPPISLEWLLSTR